MAKTDFKTVAEYLETQPKEARAILKRVRSTIKKAVPGAKEMISYQIPTFKLQGSAMLYFAGWKEHYAIYPATSGVVKTFKDELKPYEVRKGTIRFPFTEPVPVRLIAAIAKLRAKEEAEKAAAKKR